MCPKTYPTVLKLTCKAGFIIHAFLPKEFNLTLAKKEIGKHLYHFVRIFHYGKLTTINVNLQIKNVRQTFIPTVSNLK